MVQALIFDVFGTCVDWRSLVARAFVPRPTEYGPGQTTGLMPEADWDRIAAGFNALVRMLYAPFSRAKATNCAVEPSLPAASPLFRTGSSALASSLPSSTPH